MEKVKEMIQKVLKNKLVLAIAFFVVVAIVELVVGICVLKESIVPLCILFVLEVAIAVLLHNIELWMHGVVLVAEIIIGLIVGKIAIVLLCALIYIVALVSLRLMEKGKE